MKYSSAKFLIAASVFSLSQTLITSCTCTRDPSAELATPPSLEKAPAEPSKPSDIHDFVPGGKKPPNDAVHAAAQADKAPTDSNHTFAGGLTWTAPAIFKRRPPRNEMRAAEYIVEKQGAEPAELTVYFFGPNGGGSAEENFQRWTAQFSPEGRTIKRSNQLAKTKISVIDIRGTFLGMAMPGEPAAAPKPRHRMIAAVAEGPTGPVFFKLTGPESVVSGNEKPFATLLSSVHAL
jgi:hypothetical protein